MSLEIDFEPASLQEQTVGGNCFNVLPSRFCDRCLAGSGKDGKLEWFLTTSAGLLVGQKRIPSGLSRFWVLRLR